MNHAKPLLLLFAGAGFAAHAGAPVMKDFWDRARKRLPDEILRCIGAGFYFAEYAMGERADLETAYGAMVFRQVVHGPHFRVATRVSTFTPSREGPKIGEVVDGFERGIACVYGGAVLEDKNRWVGDYSEFFDYLLARFRVGVVTTNYDLVVETALGRVERAGTYCGSQAGCGSKDAIPILKLHGSVNWPQNSKRELGTIGMDAEPVERPLVIPPTWNKALIPNEPITAVWRDAIELISAADAVLVIGHSFPTTDMHLDYLFAEGMSKREGAPAHKRVTVADPDVKTGARVRSRFDRYQTVERAVRHRVGFEKILSALQEGRIVLEQPGADCR